MTDKFLMEYMIRAESETYVCRIWRDEGPHRLPNDNIKEMAEREIDPAIIDVRATCFNIANWSGVNSVEIISKVTGDGICIHKNWP